MLKKLKISLICPHCRKPIEFNWSENEYNMNLDKKEDNSILRTILKYSNDEIPSKFKKAKELVDQIIYSGGKVVIWACYIKTIEFLSEFLSSAGIYNKTLYGETPIATDDIDPEFEELTREAIVKEFNDLNSGLNVLIANPFYPIKR